MIARQAAAGESIPLRTRYTLGFAPIGVLFLTRRVGRGSRAPNPSRRLRRVQKSIGGVRLSGFFTINAILKGHACLHIGGAIPDLTG